MARYFAMRLLSCVVALSLLIGGAWATYLSAQAAAQKDGSAKETKLEQRFATEVQPFVERYCSACHGPKKPKAGLDLSRDNTVKAVVKNARQWEAVLDVLQAQEMPPEDAPRRPDAKERAAVVAWIRD